MKLSLSVGEASLKVYHTKPEAGKRRCTKVSMKFADGTVVPEEAHCSLKDNFCKRTGRKLATTRLLRALPVLTRDDRRAIWRAVLPEFTTQQS